LSCGVQVVGAIWWAATRIMAGVEDLVQRTGDDRTYRVLGVQMILGSGTLCVACTVHVETRSASFLVESQNEGRRFLSGLASKPLG
jgi:hypothetical protein